MRFTISRAGIRLFSIVTGFACIGIANTVLADTPGETLPSTQLLSWTNDLSARMVAGIDRFLIRQIEDSVRTRQEFWKRDFSTPSAYSASVQPNRGRLARSIGIIDERVPFKSIEYLSNRPTESKLAETEGYAIYEIRWPVFDDVDGEGLLVQPKTEPAARVVVIPEADQTPEMLLGLIPGIPQQSQFARRLAESGCQVIIPVLIDRQDTWSGNPRLNRFTNQPHREWIYRQAFEMGRHIIGYEVEKTMAAIDWFTLENKRQQGSPHGPVKIGVAGYGEGGLIALYTGALDTRIDATFVSGYFSSRERIWEEPIYRNVFGLLREFGDAEMASLIAPRSVLIEYSPTPKSNGPRPPRDGHGGGAPGRLATPESFLVENEVNRAKAIFPASFKFPLEYVFGNEGTTVGPGSEQALELFLRALGISDHPRPDGSRLPHDQRQDFDPGRRQKRQLQQLVNHTQRLLQTSDTTRQEFFWNKVKPTATNAWESACSAYREIMWNDVIGRFPKASLPENPRSRRILENSKWTAYDIVLDVWPDVFAWGILILPSDLQPGERRPVVVCQHGLEGVPMDTIRGPNESGYNAYKSFAATLAEQGFVVFAPHNPYRGEDAFRVLQRKANPLGKSLFSIILAQHDRILDWLSEQPFVDPQRIAFYGLSYGGKTAMRVPALLDRYCLSICSADFNDWVRKNATIDSNYSYMFMGEYELPEFNLGNTFNYAEMAALIAPRPFMVERGHDDGVAPDEWVAYEYAKVRRLYAKLGIPDRTEIEFFNGPHTINGKGTFEFLHRHLNWPKQ